MCIKHPGSFRDVCGCFLSFTSLSFDVSQSSPLLCLPPCLSCSLPLTSSSLSLRLSCFTHLLSSAISSLWQHISVSNASPSLISERCAIIVFHRLFLCQAALMFVLFRADLHILTGQRQYFVCLCSDFLFFFLMSVSLSLLVLSVIVLHARLWMDFVAWKCWPPPFSIFTLCVCVAQEPQLWGAPGASQSECDWS